MLGSDDISASGGGDDNVHLGRNVLHGGDLVTGHGGLEGVDGVDLSDNDSGTVSSESLSATLSNVSETGDDGDLTGQHDVGGSLDTVDKGLSATVLLKGKE